MGQINKESFRNLVGRYKDNYYWGQKWPLLIKIDASDTQTLAVRGVFTDFI